MTADGGCVRLAYHHRGEEDPHPGEAALNLPGDMYSHDMRRRAAEEATQGSSDEAATAGTPGRTAHQAGSLTIAIGHYTRAQGSERRPPPTSLSSPPTPGVVMPPEVLRAARRAWMAPIDGPTTGYHASTPSPRRRYYFPAPRDLRLATANGKIFA